MYVFKIITQLTWLENRSECAVLVHSAVQGVNGGIVKAASSAFSEHNHAKTCPTKLLLLQELLLMTVKQSLQCEHCCAKGS